MLPAYKELEQDHLLLKIIVIMHSFVHFHNQIEEIYTSGGDLHLELPTGEREASQDFWVSVTYFLSWPKASNWNNLNLVFSNFHLLR